MKNHRTPKLTYSIFRRYVAGALFFCLVAVHSHGQEVYSNVESFIGGAGSFSTNDAFSLRSSWRQATQTSISSAGDIVNYSGFIRSFELVAIDSDGDGLSDDAEAIAGTNPADSNDVFRIENTACIAADQSSLTVRTHPGRRYTIFYTDDLSSTGTVWKAFATTHNGVGVWVETNSTGSEYSFVDDFTINTSGARPSLNRRFYRIQVELMGGY